MEQAGKGTAATASSSSVGRRAGACRAAPSEGQLLPEPGAGFEPWRGDSTAHTKEEAAATAAAPAMLCYVTRPDAVLMEVEVEAKANGEDCLNQVRAEGQPGAPAGPPRPRGLLTVPGAWARRLPGLGWRCSGGQRARL